MHPKKLNKCPLLEALFEIRFEPENPSAAELLPGLFFSEFKDKYNELVTLPAAGIPAQIRDADPNLKYQIHHHLTGSGRRLGTGSRIVNFTMGPEYPGWEVFREEIKKIIDHLRVLKIMKKVERMSFRYINLIPTEKSPQLSLLDGNFFLHDKSISEKGFHLRFEIHENNFFSIVQVATETSAKKENEHEKRGLLVDIDTVCTQGLEDFLENSVHHLEKGHSTEKKTFFSLLKSETLEQLDPIWEE